MPPKLFRIKIKPWKELSETPGVLSWHMANSSLRRPNKEDDLLIHSSKGAITAVDISHMTGPTISALASITDIALPEHRVIVVEENSCRAVPAYRWQWTRCGVLRPRFAEWMIDQEFGVQPYGEIRLGQMPGFDDLDIQTRRILMTHTDTLTTYTYSSLDVLFDDKISEWEGVGKARKTIIHKFATACLCRGPYKLNQVNEADLGDGKLPFIHPDDGKRVSMVSGNLPGDDVLPEYVLWDNLITVFKDTYFWGQDIETPIVQELLLVLTDHRRKLEAAGCFDINAVKALTNIITEKKPYLFRRLNNWVETYCLSRLAE